jgi:hypothetical protein
MPAAALVAPLATGIKLWSNIAARTDPRLQRTSLKTAKTKHEHSYEVIGWAIMPAPQSS